VCKSVSEYDLGESVLTTTHTRFDANRNPEFTLCTAVSRKSSGDRLRTNVGTTLDSKGWKLGIAVLAEICACRVAGHDS
jgi:hypothetical protein